MNVRKKCFAVMAAVLTPSVGWACACGCGVFDVGTSSMLPQGPGGMVFAEYDFQDQTWNWSRGSRAPAVDNPDKEIRTDFTMLGLQYMFNRSWGVQVELPYDVRYFQTTGGASGSDIVSTKWGAFGDLRLEGIYAGFSPDMSAGVTFGVKLPTGDFSRNDAYGDIDRDSELGTGSTDLLLGGFYRHTLNSVAHGLYWFAQAKLDVPTLIQAHYRPGVELDTALGLYYQGWSLGKVRITPVAQVIPCERTSDTGSAAASPVASGYQRILLSPGIEFHLHPVKVYADVEFPVYEHTTGDQLVAPAMFKVIVSYMF
ncbi:MAG: transporter [Verrucomicrobiota bacterium]